MSFLFTSESVSYGHPDKVADQISDLLLDYFIKNYNQPKVAIETMIARNTVIIGGEVSVDFKEENLIKEIKEFLMHSNSVPYLKNDIEKLKVIFLLDKQSSEINHLVTHDDETIGAGDQGIMYGYANNDTENYMPAPIYYAKKILDKVLNDFDFLGPDAKSQVAICYNENKKPQKIEKILLSIQHPEKINYKDLHSLVYNSIIDSCDAELIDENTEVIVNPAGSFITGGPFADTGLTGRKIIVDSYGAFAPHGGGAFSGKDPTKVDRSASYMARYLAKNIVASRLADEAVVQIAYTIGMEQPFSFSIDTRGTGIIKDSEIEKIVLNLIDLSPKAIIERFNLWRPIYYKTASLGHFGINDLPWEVVDLSDDLRKSILYINNFSESIKEGLQSNF